MRKEIEDWVKQALADLRKAEVLINSKNFDGAVFFCQQAVEKSLKALYMLKLKEIPKGHSIIYFAQKVNVPKEMLSGIRDLNPEYLITRYPDMAAGIPAELYDAEIANRHKKTAEQVLKWVEQKIKK
ncbi:MAG: HEPN domain-containing protein [Nanoarchaeota archaeon]